MDDGSCLKARLVGSTGNLYQECILRTTHHEPETGIPRQLDGDGVSQTQNESNFFKRALWCAKT